ncbi:MAG TPA: tetratricopeptide repeat protein, partial [Planctomycetes bacterium]|nr:tetratricopeptide repeat protein [Planctomycetota bacterium]
PDDGSADKNFSDVMELGRLYAVTAMGGKAIPLLAKAKKLEPQSPLPYKYMAIAQVDTSYRYREAVGEMDEYVRRAPDDVFGHNFIGYLYYQTGRYDDAVGALKRAVEMRTDNGYGWCLLARAYARMRRGLAPADPSRKTLERQAHNALENARAAASCSAGRVRRLEAWLRVQGTAR